MYIYNASKGGVLQLTKCMAMDLAEVSIAVLLLFNLLLLLFVLRLVFLLLLRHRSLHVQTLQDNIRVNAICPGSILTPAAYNHMKHLGMPLSQPL